MHDLFGAGESLLAGRVRLSRLDCAALDTMAWLDAALAPEWDAGDLARAASTQTGVLISSLDGAPIGAAVVRLAAPAASDATILFLAIEPDRRFRGLGGEAGIALERHLRRLGHERVFAPVTEGRGLAVYFWLRLGFRPLSAAGSPGPLLGLTDEAKPGIWMVRDPSSPPGQHDGPESAIMRA